MVTSKPTNTEVPAFRTITNPVSNDKVVFLETSRESNGRHTLLEITLAAKGGSFLRCYENFSEELLCLEGELSVQIGNRTSQLMPGHSATASARRKHRFFNHTSEPCRFQCRITPGCPGIEQSLQITYGLIRAGKANAHGVPRNLFERSYLMMISGTCLPGWMAALQPVLPWLAKQAIHNGRAADLQRRYFTVW